jgi:hypothetical protein
MKITIQRIIFFCCICSSTQLLAQLDNTNGTANTGKIKAYVNNSAKLVNKPNSIELDAKEGFKKAYDDENKKLKEQKADEDFNNKGLLTQAKLREQQFAKNFKKINGRYHYPKIDQDLGSFRNIICRDFQYPDGDRVTIFVNDIPVIVNLVLKQNYQKFNIPLEVGINKIVIKALNQGTSGPNTAAFKVFNDAGMLLSSNEWNLATDAKATLMIVKDK